MVENHGEDYKVRPTGKNRLGLLGKYTGLFQPVLQLNRMKEESKKASHCLEVFMCECFAVCMCMCITCTLGTCGAQKVLDPL